MVVEFAIDNGVDSGFRVVEGLLAGRGEIIDGETRVAECFDLLALMKGARPSVKGHQCVYPVKSILQLRQGRDDGSDRGFG